ncbi:MAG TPA: hypothetical protein VMW86_01580 [Dehalococcoidales bacterium]|nr:hypothetical protein [Dehalococcoidales bacterium]
MNRPPMLMHLKIQGEDTNFGLWLPLFLLIPLALVVLIILSPFILIGVLVLWPSGWGKLALLALWAAIVSFCSLRGLKVDVQGRRESVFISVV